MTTGWLIVNIVLIAVVAAIVAVPAVLIPSLLDRDARRECARPSARTAQQPAQRRGWASDGTPRRRRLTVRNIPGGRAPTPSPTGVAGRGLDASWST